MLNRPAVVSLDDVEVKINEIKKICDAFHESELPEDVSKTLDRLVNSLLNDLKKLITESESELDEFNRQYPYPEEMTKLRDQIVGNEKAHDLMKKKLQESRRQSVTSQEEISISENEIKTALDDMKQWNVKQLIQEAASFQFKKSILSSGSERDQLAIKIEKEVGRILEVSKKDELIWLGQIYARRTKLQWIYMELMKYKERDENTKSQEMSHLKLQAIDQTFSKYKRACSSLFNYVNAVKLKGGDKLEQGDVLKDIIDFTENNDDIILLTREEKKEEKDENKIPVFYQDIPRKVLLIEGKNYKKGDILQFVKDQLQSKIQPEKLDTLIESIKSRYTQDIIKFPTIVLNSKHPNKIYNPQKCQANLYIENGEVYIKVNHSNFLVTDELGVQKEENISVEASFKLGKKGFELINIDEKQQKKGLSSSLSTPKKLMLGIGAALLIGGVSVLTAGLGGVALVAAGCALGTGAATTLGVGISTSRFGTWYNSLTGPKKLALWCLAGAVFVGIGILTAGFAYAGLAGLTVAAAIVAGATAKAGLGVGGAIAVKTAVGVVGVAAGAKITDTIAKSPSSTAVIAKKSNMNVSNISNPRKSISESKEPVESRAEPEPESKLSQESDLDSSNPRQRLSF